MMMIRKSNRLEPLEPVKTSTTGEIWKTWIKNHPQTGGMSALQILADPLSNTETEILPAIQRPPRFHEYRNSASPTAFELLYGATLACINKFGCLPDMLFVSPVILPGLQRQTEEIIGVSYDWKYRFYFQASLKFLPLRTEAQLPDILKIALGGSIARDTVIGVVWQ